MDRTVVGGHLTEDDRRRAGSASPLVARPRLLRALSQGAAGRLTLVVAPAGYGKTTLLAEWLACPPGLSPAAARGGASVSLSEMDNEPGHFLDSLIAGMQARVPGFVPAVDRSSPLPYALTLLFQQGARAAGGAWLLVLDDYHLVTNPAIHQALDGVLGQPALPLRLVIASRKQPPLAAIARLRVEGRLVEVDEAALRFTVGEMERFLSGSGLALEEAAVRQIAERTEGWPAALQLLRQAAQRERQPDLAAIVGRLGDERPLFDYLAGQVLEGQPAGIQDFLRRTSLLPYLSAGLCNAFLGIADASAILDDLERAHLFVSPLPDGPGRCFRYHALFQGFLRRCLEQDEGARAVEMWHRRAAACLLEAAGRGGSDDRAAAVEHLLAAREWTAAADSIEALFDGLDGERSARSAGWFDRFPPAILAARPRLLLALGLVRARQCRWAEAMAAYSRAEGLLDPAGGDAAEVCRVLCGQAWVYLWQSRRAEAGELAQRAQAAWHRAPAAPRRQLAQVHTLLAACSEGSDPHGQEEHQRRALDLFRQIGDRRGEARLLGNIASTLLDRGRMGEALETAHTSRRLYDEMGSYDVWRALTHLGEIYVLLGEPDEARAPLERQLQLGDTHQDPVVRGYALYLLGHVHREQGRHAAARACYAEARLLGEELQEPYVLFEPRLGLALLSLAEGDLREARRHGQAAWQQAASVGNRYQEALALMALGLVVDQGGDARQAEASWDEALRLFQSWGAKLYQATLHLYLADLYRREGRDEQALEQVGRALALSSEGGYDFLFTRREPQRAVPLLVLALGQTFEVLETSKVLEACRLLAKVGQGAVEPLLGLLARAGVDVQKRVVDLLGEIGDERAVPPLSALRQNLDPRLEKRVQAALLRIAAAPRPPLRVVALGGFQVRRGDPSGSSPSGQGVAIPAGAWQRRKTRLLLLYLLTQAPRRVPAEELIEALWPDLPPGPAGRVLNTTVSELRRILEPYLGKGQPSRYLVRDEETLAFHPTAEIWYDVAVFQQAVRAGGQAARQALELYRGDLLPEEPYVDWVQRERERLRSLYLNTLTAWLEEQVQAGAWREGAELARRILDEEPWLEEVWQALMTCLARLGRRSEALQAYQACARALQEELDVSPSAETSALYEELKA
ncbi:MAG: tetratricopeptide repeat protein [Anaerolineae bacterium]|nr:tetratricopeptide repeat protein [Anaerolineae bacterium]